MMEDKDIIDPEILTQIWGVPYPHLESVEFLNDFTIISTFKNGIKKRYNFKDFIDTHEGFKKLTDLEFFKTGRTNIFGIVWDDEIDCDAYLFWKNGEEITL